MKQIFEFISGLLKVIKDNMNYILSYLLHGEIVQRKVREALDEVEAEEKRIKAETEEFKKKANDMTRAAQERIDKLKKPMMAILACFLFFGCATTRVIYRTEYIKPELPELHLCGDKPLATMPVSEMEVLFHVQCGLYYEEQILIYREWKKDFEALHEENTDG